MYRYVVDSHLDLITIIAGIIQTALYIDFFYLYVTKGKNNFETISTEQLQRFYVSVLKGEKIELPV